MDDEDLRAVLEDAGLAPYQAAAYVAVLDLGSATATDVADACEVPDPRIYDVLRSLEEKGYVETYESDALTVRANDPETVLEDLRSRSNQYLTAAEEIEERWNEPDADDGEVSIVTRFDTVLRRSREHLAEADHEIVLATPPSVYRELRPALVDARDRDVHVKLTVFPGEEATEPPDAEEIAGSCTEARYRELPAAYLLVVDRTATCYAPDREAANGYGVVVNDPIHTHVFHWFFRSVNWETWETVYDARDGTLPETYVDLVECLRRIDAALAAGQEVTVEVTGDDTRTREARTVRGAVVDTDYSGDHLDLEDAIPLAPLAGRNSLTLRTEGGETVTVGGWGARLEDLEARRITVTDIGD